MRSHSICRLALPLAACLLAGALAHGPANSAEREAVTAASELQPDDLKAIGELFGKLGEKFLAGDAAGCRALFLGKMESRARIQSDLENEFAQSRYLEFKILEIRPDDSKGKLHSVDATLRYKLVQRDSSASNSTAQIENTINHNFVLERSDQGTFWFVRSAFFENMGMRKGIAVLVVNALLSIMAMVALLSFWVWMGWEAWRVRPRSRFWRVLVCVPVLGALAFFFGKYLPSRIRVLRGMPA